MSEGYGTGDICTGNNSINQNSRERVVLIATVDTFIVRKVSCLLLSKQAVLQN